MNKLYAIVVLLTLAAAAPVWADVAADHYNRGNRLYEQERFAEALTAYQAAHDAGAEDADLYLNFGNAAFRIGETGLAVWAYEKGLFLAPRDNDLRFNLRYAEAFQRDELPAVQQVWLVRAARAVALWFTTGEALALAICGWLLLGAAVMAWRLVRRGRAWLVVAGVVALLLLVVFAPLAAWRLHDRFGLDKAIVTADEVVVRTAPADDASEAFTVHGGLRLEIVEQRHRFGRVKIPTGLQGWIPTDAYRRLHP